MSHTNEKIVNIKELQKREGNAFPNEECGKVKNQSFSSFFFKDFSFKKKREQRNGLLKKETIRSC